MAVTNYYSVDDGIIGEETGGVRHDYLTDALGSVTATVTSAAAIENTYRYKPYGETLAKTGAGSDPKFLWVGTWGYRAGSSGTLYVRARTYGQSAGRWTNLDPIQSGYNWYRYCENNPVNAIDPSGLIRKPPKWIEVLIGIIAGAGSVLIPKPGDISGGSVPPPHSAPINGVPDPNTGVDLGKKPKPGGGSGGDGDEDDTHRRIAIAIDVAIGVGLVAWEIGKWALAVAAAPETGGLSLVAAAAAP